MIYWWRGFQDGRRGKGDGENIDIKDAYLRYVGRGRVVPAVPCNLASICLERKVVIVIVSVLDLCTECVIFLKRFILILFTNVNWEQFNIIIYLPGLSDNRVTCCVVFCSIDDVFHSVIRCSLALANCSNSQETIFSRKAKSWALRQLRRASTPTLKHSNLVEVGEYWGYSAEESTEMMVGKVLRSTKTFAEPCILLQC